MKTKFENLVPSCFHLVQGTGFPSQYSSPSKGEVPQRGGGVIFLAEERVSDGRRCMLAVSGVSLKTIGRDLGLDVSVRAGELLTRPLHTADYWQQLLWRKSLSINSDFCRAVVQAGYLTWQQMLDAVCRYRLGATLQGHVIFWQIDREERICDGKIMCYNPDCHRSKDKSQAPTWVSALLAKRHGGKNDVDITRHCLFGLHLLRDSVRKGEDQPIAIVEAEKTAVILSAHYPQYLWLATGGLGEVQPEKFRPLRGRKVILFPDTDPDGKAFNYWYQAAQTVMAQPYWEDSPPIRVSALLEQHATPDQKQLKIDLVDYLFN